MHAAPFFPKAAVVLCLTLLASCRGCFGSHRESDGVPGSLQIPVEIDGAAAPPIDSALLARVPPDFTEGERRAWKLRSLLGPPCDRPGAVIEVEDAEGMKTVLARAGEVQGGREPVLAVNRIGEVRVALVFPNEPFPPFHGRGGNRGRGGDPTRIREVRRLRLLRSGDAGS